MRSTKRLPWVLLCVCAFASPLTGLAQAKEAADGKVVKLFNGTSLEGWDGDPKFWRVEDGVLIGETTKEKSAKKNTFLIYRGGEFSDFELRLSYQVENYNSGVQYRSVDKGNWSVSGYQCDFEAPFHKGVDKFTGMFFDEGGRGFMGHRGEVVIVRPNPANPKKAKVEKIGTVGDPVELEKHIKRDGWNKLVVIAKGNQFTHIINGHVMAIGFDEDAEKRRASGIIAFQLHAGPPMKIQLKDISVRVLGESNGDHHGSNGGSNAVGKGASLFSVGTTIKKKQLNYEQYALRQPGDPKNGKKLFDDTKRTKCGVCHKIAGKGGDVGVDLTKIGGKFDRPHLIESLLEPSRQIVEGYQTSVVLTDSGKTYSGIQKERDDKQIVLMDAEGKRHTIQRDEIEDIELSTVSIMPEGLEKELSLDEFTDLIAYLESLRPDREKRGGGLRGPVSLPDEYEIETVITGLDAAVALEVLPDGRILLCEQKGFVRVIENGKLLKEPFVTLPVDSYWERGVIGVTYDPGFPKVPYIYVCWVAKEPYTHHHVSRFTMKGNVAVKGSEKLLLVGDDQAKMGGHVPAGHQGGALHFGLDGKLYIAIGDQTAGEPSQKLDSFLGKILRINSDGSIPKDNPFYKEAKGKYRAIWARGFRNPFTFAFRKTDGKMLVNDVGGNCEEVNDAVAGGNYGWPVVEHGATEKGYKKKEFTAPVHWYPHTSVNGADYCPEDSEWAESGRYFFADYILGWVHTMDPDNPTDVKKFIDGIRRPVDLRFAPDGSLYVLLRNAWVIDNKFQSNSGTLLRIHRRKDAGKATSSTKTPVKVSRGSAGKNPATGSVVLTENAVDESAGGLAAFKIETASATYFLEKSGGGLSSLLDRDGNDWIGFHPKKKSGAGGEYRGFPNAVHKQDGSYFHGMNSGTDKMKLRVERADTGYVSIHAEAERGHWAGRYEFFPTHCTFTMTRMPKNQKYWILYEGTPGGSFEPETDYIVRSDGKNKPASEKWTADIPGAEWLYFADGKIDRSLLLVNHTEDSAVDSYYPMGKSPANMTVFGFGRSGMGKFLTNVPRSYSIGLVESRDHATVARFADTVLDSSK